MTKQRSFEALMAEIDSLVEKLEKPDTGLEESLRLFETGNQLITEAQRRLQALEHEFEVIQQKFGEDVPNPPSLSNVSKADTPQESLGL